MKTKLFLLLAFLCQISLAQVSDANLLAHYNFENNGQNQISSNFHFLSGNGFVTHSSFGKVGKSALFNTDGIFYNVSLKAYFDNVTNQSFTVSFWSYQSTAISNATIYFNMFNSAFIKGNTEIGIATSSTTTVSNGTQSQPLNQWNHNVYIFDQAEQRIKLYLNGNLVTSILTNSSNFNKNIAQFCVGGGITSGSFDTSTNYNAYMDEMYIFNRAITPSEITALYNLATPSSCPTGNVTLTTQAEVNAFVAQYPNCTEINGDLSLVGSGITDITPLNQIQSIFGALGINSTAITNGNIFNNLTAITGLINIQNNPNLTNLNGFNALVDGFTVQINSNPNLTQVTGFTSLTNLAGNLSFIGAQGSPVLTNISGFSNVQNISYLLVRLTGLSNLSQLSSLQSISEGMSIDQNPNLTSISGLSNCTNAVDGGNSRPFRIFSNPLLESLDGINFSNVTNSFDVQIYNLPLVQNFNQLSCLQGSFPFVNIRDMPLLQNINGLLNISGIDNLNLVNLPLVTSLPNWNLSLLNSVILNNLPNLNSISSLIGVTSMGSNSQTNAININSCSQLLNLNGLNNVSTLNNKSINLNMNNALLDISALNNLNVNTLNGLTVTNNSNLSTCNETWVCDRLALNTTNVFLAGNATGCENTSVVQTACNPDPCPPSNVTFTTQAEVSNFLAQYPNCTQINGNLTVDGWDVTNLSSLGNLTSITGDMNLYGVNSSANLTGLQSITTVGGKVYIEFQRPNVDYLSGLTSVGGLVVAGAGITNLNGLSNITGHIPGNLEVFNNPMTNLTGLNNITSVGNDLLINFMHGLTNLTGLNNITSIGKSLIIHFNNNLTSLDGLNNLTTIGDINLINSGFSLRGNSLLTNISTLENVSNIVRGFNLWDNANLTNCAIAPVCNKLANSTTNITLTGNATGCESIAVVQAACDTLSASDFELESNLKIYPNPFNSQITFDLGNSYENITVLIYDITGKQLYQNSFSGNQLVINNLGNFPSGIYVATLTTENGTSIIKKIVK
ncbi:LamG-like jellyroll fold domain-containing protein [Flavobacterium sp.]|uniref:LamG-like jellyroll fold domain-containing protein n=1 Tax=Flavobacterium sp. TaxID=239 RepID=UPI002FD88598